MQKLVCDLNFIKLLFPFVNGSSAKASASANHPILIGLLVDVSGSMTSAIQNRGTTQNRLESFRDALEKLVLEYANAVARRSSNDEIEAKLFAYGFGFGNPLARLLGRSGPDVRDLLKLSNGADSTIDIASLAQSWPRYKAHVESLATEMFGSTPMGEAFLVAKQRFAAEATRAQAQQVLFVLSDGDPTDSTPEELSRAAEELKASGVLVVSCYVTSENVTEPRRIYGSIPAHWATGARLMFECSSVLPKNSPFETYLREFGWTIDKGGRLFTQINQSELLSEFMNVILSPVKADRSLEPKLDRVETLKKVPSDLGQIEHVGPHLRQAELTPNKITDDGQVAAKSTGQAQKHTPDDSLGRLVPTSDANWPAWIFGGLLVVFFMGVIWFRPQEQIGVQQQKLLRILASVFVGVISGFFAGNLRLEGKVPALKDMQIGAIGGFAGFALTFFLW